MIHAVRHRILGIALAAAAAGIFFGAAPAKAGSLTFSLTAPTPGAADQYNFTGATHDGANVNNGATYSDGATNDGFTYVAHDRPAMGQSFTTGSSSAGYDLSSIWLRMPGYTANTVSTWWDFAQGGVLTARVTDPSAAGSSNFALATDTYKLTGTETNSPDPGTSTQGSKHSNNGPGTWIEFTFSNPVHLGANTLYGFDLSCTGNNNDFFETLGTDADVYGSGGAYISGSSGTPNNSMTALDGDRVFDVALAPSPVPLPSAAGMALVGALIMLPLYSASRRLRKQRRQESIA